MALNFIAKAPGNFLRFSQPRLKTFAKYAKVELTPPSPGELGQVKMENLQISLKQFLIKKYWPYSRKNLRSFSFPTLISILFQVVKGTAGLVGDALTFKWAQASMAQVAVNTVVVVEVK